VLKYINKVAAEERIDPNVVNDAFRDCLIQIKNTLRRPEMPKVLINGFGTFQVKSARVEYIIRKEIRKYQEGKITKQDLKEKIQPLFKIRRRLINEGK
jgi:nucleoid DNA-binding protein